MTLPPRFAGHRWSFQTLKSATAPRPTHTFEVFLDYSCPYSARFYLRMVNELAPWVEKTYPGKVDFILRQQIQSWHYTASLLHESVLMVERLNPSKFWEYSTRLFEHHKEFDDERVVDLTRNQIYQRLGEHAAAVGIDKQAFLDGLVITKNEQGGNKGNQVSADIKWHLRFARERGAHITPTVFWDGTRVDGMDSGWDMDKLKDWFGKQNVD